MRRLKWNDTAGGLYVRAAGKQLKRSSFCINDRALIRLHDDAHALANGLKWKKKDSIVTRFDSSLHTEAEQRPFRRITRQMPFLPIVTRGVPDKAGVITQSGAPTQFFECQIFVQPGDGNLATIL